MADADEDIRGPLPGSYDVGDADLDDEMQDFRFLSALSNTKDPSKAKLPKRGDKDFEPHGSHAQQEALAASRAAMHGALQGERLHPHKAHIVGYLSANSGSVLVRNPRGQLLRTVGKGAREGVWLAPEEALYLLERGSLDIRWLLDESVEQKGSECENRAENADDAEDHSENNDTGISLSLQAAYALLVDQQGLTLDRYLVYAALKRCGYSVFRAPGWDGLDAPSEPVRDAGTWTFFLSALFSRLSTSRDPPALGPLVRPGLYRNYQDIYRRLAVVPFHHPASTVPSPHSSLPNRPRVLYHVYKPTPFFAKSHPGPPDFYLTVVSARETALPTLPDFDSLFADTAPASKPTHHNRYARLKGGWQSVIVAVVDTGVVSYLRFTEGAFGQEKLFEDIGKHKGTKGKMGRKGKWKGGKI